MSELQEITPEYVYLTIPAEYVCVYHRLLVMMADYGVELLNDCKADCKDRNVDIIKCFNMFNSAIAARQLKQDKLAETLIKYIKTRINQIYKNKPVYTTFEVPITEDGILKALVTCGDNIKFEVDEITGELYEKRIDNKCVFSDNTKVYDIDNNNLIVK